MSDWNVITAGPSAGKTSTLRELNARGYRVAPEAARLYIDQQISEGRDEEEIHNDPNFQSEIIAEDRRIENNILEGDKPVFLDRSLADNIAYIRYFSDNEPSMLLEEVEDRYDNVFLLEQLPFEDDYARRENPEQARELHGELREAYEDAGYDVIEVPLMPVDERADYIIDELQTYW